MTSYLARRLILIVLAAIVGLLVLDIKEHGSFKASKTGGFLKDSGALHYGEIAWSNFRSYSQQGYKWCQKNFPVYATTVREGAAPHLRTSRDWLVYLAQQLWANVKLLYGYCWEKKPLVEQWVNHYAPGLVDIVGSWLRQAWTFLRDYSALVVNFLLKYLLVAGQWLGENVFVPPRFSQKIYQWSGSLSPENLQKYTMDALNTTQQLASRSFSWLNDKVVTVMSAS